MGLLWLGKTEKSAAAWVRWWVNRKAGREVPLVIWYRRDGSGQGNREKGAVGSPTFVERRVMQTVRGRAAVFSRWSAVSGIDQ